MLGNNLLLATDSYKVSHHLQYPQDVTNVYSFLEARKSTVFDETTFFGLQYFLNRYFAGQVVTQQKIDEAAEYYEAHFGSSRIFNREGWEYILHEHDGRLPIRIKAVPEGITVNNHNVLLTVENTDDRVPWLTNYVETLLVQLWYPITVCTQSRHMKKILDFYLTETSDDVSGLSFKLHDFGFRGSTSYESAAIGGAAHLVNFQGTDTVAALELLRQHYYTRMAGFSIPAAEHSTITSWGRDNELQAYKNMLVQFPAGLVAVVSDSYDIYKAVDHLWGQVLRERVLLRNGTVVIRPDSGDPEEVLPILLESLGKTFGYRTNNKGYKVLDDHVRLIQGDGIDRRELPYILEAITDAGWSADNLAFGSGGGLLQKLDRDTCGFAMKCSAVKKDGAWVPVYKDPIGDSSKRSKAGRLKLVRTESGYTTVEEWFEGEDVMRVVFEDGFIRQQDTLSIIRERAAF